ncbi:hypothetical protein MRX96_006133 [Rhipicephalus microplus]
MAHMTETAEKNTPTSAVSDDRVLSTPISAARASWDLPIPNAMSFVIGVAPLLDQVALQQTTTFPVHLTPWQWAERLCPVSIKVARGQEFLKTQLSYIPFRLAALREMEAVGPGEVTLTPVYEHMISALAQNLGEFAAGRFFCLPSTIDTAAMVNITSFVGHLAFPVRDKAPMVRCALLNELVLLASNIKKLTQLPTRFGPSLRIDTVKRRVEGPGAGVPTGKIGCVDLGTYTRILGGSFILEGDYADLGPGTWGSGTALVPISFSVLGNRFAVPYLLSFVGSEYWSMRVWYSLGCKDSLAPEGQKDVTILTVPYASTELHHRRLQHPNRAH